MARVIRADKDLGSTIMIALSGYGQESDKKRSTLEGFNAHLVKPVRFQDLKNELKKAHTERAKH